MEILEILKVAIEAGASDVHLTVASPPIMRVNGKLIRMADNKLMPEDTYRIIQQMLSVDQSQMIEKKR